MCRSTIHYENTQKANMLCVSVQNMIYRIRFNFRGVKLSQITNFRVFIFVVCDVIAQTLPVWSEFSQDETFADGY